MCSNSPPSLRAKINLCEGRNWLPGRTLGTPAFVTAPEDTFYGSVDTQVQNPLASKTIYAFLKPLQWISKYPPKTLA